MKTVVFVDELLLVNFAAAAALLLGAGLLCGRSCTGLRLCAGSAAAAVSTLALLAPPWCAPLAVLYKIVSCCCVVAVCYGVPGARSFARLCGWYAALNGVLCGAVVLPGVQTNNLSVLLPVRPGQLLLCCAGVYALLRGLLERETERFARAGCELFARLGRDRGDISRSLLGTEDFGLVTRISTGAGDLHLHGRSTSVIETQRGRFVYKPRDCGIDRELRELVGRVMPDCLGIPKCLVREGYGWCEYI